MHRDESVVKAIHPEILSQDIVHEDERDVIFDRVLNFRGKRSKVVWKFSRLPPERLRHGSISKTSSISGKTKCEGGSSSLIRNNS
jgi:hypothetical protein